MNPFEPGALQRHNRAAERIRAVQREQSLGPVDMDAVRRVLSQFIDDLDQHAEHGDWHETGRCVWCSCGARLYQGRLPRRPPGEEQ